MTSALKQPSGDALASCEVGESKEHRMVERLMLVSQARGVLTLVVLLAAMMFWGVAFSPNSHAQSNDAENSAEQPIEWSPELKELVEESCIACHDSSTDTELDLESLTHDLAEAEPFEAWEAVFDRVSAGEMPPASEQRPDTALVDAALKSLKRHLRTASLEKQSRIGRVPARRLTKLEFGNTLRDLLLIESDVTSGIPAEVDSGSFDTVGDAQRISAVHLESYLSAADEALNQAIQLGPNPFKSFSQDFGYAEEWHEKPLSLGGSVTRKLKDSDGIALFADVDYLTILRTGIPFPAKYLLSARVAAHQSEKPLAAKFIVKEQGGASRLVKSIDLAPGDPALIEFEVFMKPGDITYLTFDAKEAQGLASVFLVGGAKHYVGPGLAIYSQGLEGPVFESWPPPSTNRLLSGLKLESRNGASEGPFHIKETLDTMAEVRRIVHELAPLVFRRAVDDEELEAFVVLAQTALDEGRDIVSALKVPLRAMLSSPQFLLFSAEPGLLDDYALANRLSYFLSKSMPDDRLLGLASRGELSNSEVLADEVDRLLANPESRRFVTDFLGQWLRLHKVNATTPDDGLYPEYDELLGAAITQETEHFFAELIESNLSLRNLIDSDFTFVNRRLAKLYGLPGVEGQEFRRVELPASSPRGGVLTQAAVLKTTANGTTTSPVTRGNFVLTNFLGTPPSPPPPGVGSVEPDTRGKTTIREILASHRDNESCNVCHIAIDPPGFALESFDPIGQFRTYYRTPGGEQSFGGFVAPLPPKRGPKVDPSGKTKEGHAFANIDEFKKLLLAEEEQVARNFISKLLVYATGGEIEFADRDEIEAIRDRTARTGYRVKDIIHEVVQSQIFRNL